MIALLDVNVLIALAWPNHVHHGAAHAWLVANRSRGWATSPPTQAGFLRVSSNSKIIPAAKSPREALEFLRAIVRLPEHVFLPDDVDLSRSPHFLEARLLGHRQVSDAHLLAIALNHDARLATFDQGIRQLLSPDQAQAVIEIPT